MKHLRPSELKAWLDDPNRPKPLLLDVREPWEFQLCRIDGSMNIPLQSVPVRLGELDGDQEVVCICHHGVRSHHAARFLEHNGFTNIINLSGGVDGWAKEADPTMPVY